MTALSKKGRNLSCSGEKNWPQGGRERLEGKSAVAGK